MFTQQSLVSSQINRLIFKHQSLNNIEILNILKLLEQYSGQLTPPDIINLLSNMVIFMQTTPEILGQICQMITTVGYRLSASDAINLFDKWEKDDLFSNMSKQNILNNTTIQNIGYALINSISKINIPDHIDMVEKFEFYTQRKKGYARFLTYAKRHYDHYHFPFLNLGNVAEEKNVDLYFKPDEKNAYNAIYFLSAFFTDEQSISLMQEDYNDKIKYLNQLTNRPINQSTNRPSNISFLTYELHNKNYCLIALSSAANKRETSQALMLQLAKVTNLLNETPSNANTQYILLDGNLDEINMLIASAKNNFKMPPSIETRRCSEKYLFSYLLKLYLESGNAIKIMGSINLKFMPLIEWSADKDINLLRINDDIFMEIQGGCDHCQTNKEPILKMLSAAQSAGEEAFQQNPRERIRTSPIRRSIFRPSNNTHLPSATSGEAFIQNKRQRITTSPIRNSIFRPNNNAQLPSAPSNAGPDAHSFSLGKK